VAEPAASVEVPTTPRTDTSARRPLEAPQRTINYWFSRLAAAVVVRAWVRLRVEGRERLPPGSAVYCFSHLSWADPIVLMAALPFRPRLAFFGPRETDMGAGRRNRIMAWSGTTLPYKPDNDDLLAVTRRVRDVFASGGAVAIAGEGRIHARESELLPLNEGAAYFALRSGVPIVPIGINGTSWLRFGGRVRIRIGEPIAASGRPTRVAVAALTQRTWTALHELVADHPEVRKPGPFGRWLTEAFNEWPEGARPSADG